MKRVKLVPHESTDSRESIELDEYTDDDDDEVFLRSAAAAAYKNGHCKDASQKKPLMRKKVMKIRQRNL